MRHHYPKSLAPKHTNIVHHTGTTPRTSIWTTCGVPAVMRSTDKRSLVTCKNCLKRLLNMDIRDSQEREAKIRYEARLGLTEDEKGTL